MEGIRTVPFCLARPQLQPQPLPSPPPTPNSAGQQASHLVNLVFQVAVPANQLMLRGGLGPGGAFQLFAAPQQQQQLSIPMVTRSGQVVQLQLTSPAIPSQPQPPLLVPAQSTATPRPPLPPQKIAHSTCAHPTPDSNLALPKLEPMSTTPTSPPTSTLQPPTRPASPNTTTATASASTDPSSAHRHRRSAPCPHNRRRSQCIACFELGHGGGSICIHRRRKAGCRQCRTEGRRYSDDGRQPRRRIRGPNTYVPPPLPPQTAVAVAGGNSVSGGRGIAMPTTTIGTAPTPPKKGPSVFSVEALCGLPVHAPRSPAEPSGGLRSPESTPRSTRRSFSGSPTPEVDLYLV
ncbi:hypothetical protein DFJ73DRAFT_780438 [Zopfochytrium polystomum]|nr:hypothetical protein DFJ73DRAFT_780438 [Zopfochytrium polystomum]